MHKFSHILLFSFCLMTTLMSSYSLLYTPTTITEGVTTSITASCWKEDGLNTTMFVAGTIPANSDFLGVPKQAYTNGLTDIFLGKLNPETLEIDPSSLVIFGNPSYSDNVSSIVHNPVDNVIAVYWWVFDDGVTPAPPVAQRRAYVSLFNVDTLAHIRTETMPLSNFVGGTKIVMVTGTILWMRNSEYAIARDEWYVAGGYSIGCYTVEDIPTSGGISALTESYAWRNSGDPTYTNGIKMAKNPYTPNTIAMMGFWEDPVWGTGYRLDIDCGLYRTAAPYDSLWNFRQNDLKFIWPAPGDTKTGSPRSGFIMFGQPAATKYVYFGFSRYHGQSVLRNYELMLCRVEEVTGTASGGTQQCFFPIYDSFSTDLFLWGDPTAVWNPYNSNQMLIATISLGSLPNDNSDPIGGFDFLLMVYDVSSMTLDTAQSRRFGGYGTENVNTFLIRPATNIPSYTGPAQWQNALDVFFFGDTTSQTYDRNFNPSAIIPARNAFATSLFTCDPGHYLVLNETVDLSQTCYACPAGQYLNTTYGHKEVSCLSCGNSTRITSASATIDPASCYCLPGYYTILSNLTAPPICLECPAGATCDGGLIQPYPQSNYVYNELTETYDVCDSSVFCPGGPNSTQNALFGFVLYGAGASAQSCQCPPGLFCPGGADNSISVIPGYYRPDPVLYPLLVLECPFGAVCLGTTAEDPLGEKTYSDSGFSESEYIQDRYVECLVPPLSPIADTNAQVCQVYSKCEPGYYGKFCSTCSPGYSRRFGSCVKCDDGYGVQTAWFVIVVIVVILSLWSSAYYRTSPVHLPPEKRAIWLLALFYSFLLPLAIIGGSSVMADPPDAFVAFISSFFAPFSLDFISAATGCSNSEVATFKNNFGLQLFLPFYALILVFALFWLNIFYYVFTGKLTWKVLKGHFISIKEAAKVGVKTGAFLPKAVSSGSSTFRRNGSDSDSSDEDDVIPLDNLDDFLAPSPEDFLQPKKVLAPKPTKSADPETTDSTSVELSTLNLDIEKDDPSSSGSERASTDQLAPSDAISSSILNIDGEIEIGVDTRARDGSEEEIARASSNLLNHLYQTSFVFYILLLQIIVPIAIRTVFSTFMCYKSDCTQWIDMKLSINPPCNMTLENPLSLGRDRCLNWQESLTMAPAIKCFSGWHSQSLGTAGGWLLFYAVVFPLVILSRSSHPPYFIKYLLRIGKFRLYNRNRNIWWGVALTGNDWQFKSNPFWQWAFYILFTMIAIACIDLASFGVFGAFGISLMLLLTIKSKPWATPISNSISTVGLMASLCTMIIMSLNASSAIPPSLTDSLAWTVFVSSFLFVSVWTYTLWKQDKIAFKLRDLVPEFLQKFLRKE